MQVKEFYHQDTGTLSYIIFSEIDKVAVCIDPVLDYCIESNKTSNESVKSIIEFIKNNKLELLYIMETHIHADHLSAMSILKDSFPKSTTAIGKNVAFVQDIFSKKLDINISTDGSQFEVLFDDNQIVKISDNLHFKVIFTPGHTPSCCCYLFNNSNIFVGDLIFMPDSGTARCDFPGGSSKELYRSIHKIYALSDNTIIYVGHDYCPNGRQLQFKTTIEQSKKYNIMLPESISEDDFIQVRDKRDNSLNNPTLMLPSVKHNINAGK